MSNIGGEKRQSPVFEDKEFVKKVGLQQKNMLMYWEDN